MMSKNRFPYAPEFRQQMIELVRAGPGRAGEKFEPSAQTNRNWVAQVDRDEGRREVVQDPLHDRGVLDTGDHLDLAAGPLVLHRPLRGR